MVRLRPGDAAPDFTVEEINSRRPIRLADFQGHPTLISFHRYAACPFCNLHIHELSREFPRLEASGFKILAIFSSLPDRLADQFSSRKVPFPIVADPSLLAYDAYGIEKSTMGMLASFVHPRGLVATLKGYLPGKIDGDVRWLPADFLLSPEHRIERVYYSTNITQHLSMKEIERFASAFE
ncbi:peroxiredoxin-like family protein [Gimesia maris]|uniref:peroxiredoxin-like family protein n=1 Tax=Gimesia maris TaxID=122 RepID=UPI003A8E6C4D